MPSTFFHVFKLLVKKPHRAQTQECQGGQEFIQKWTRSSLKTIHCFKWLPDATYFKLLHFLARFSHSWGFPLVPVSWATTQNTSLVSEKKRTSGITGYIHFLSLLSLQEILQAAPRIVLLRIEYVGNTDFDGGKTNASSSVNVNTVASETQFFFYLK